MLTSLTAINALILFTTMLVLALVPSVNVLLVSTRAISFGFLHDAMVTLGIVTADIAFILLSIYGLSLLADQALKTIMTIGAVYLIWLGLRYWLVKEIHDMCNGSKDGSLLSSYLAGLSITIADQKAILFYLALLPAFIDLSKITLFDTGLIIAIMICSIAVAKLGYACLAARSRSIFSPQPLKTINFFAGGLMISIGLFILVTNQ